MKNTISRPSPPGCAAGGTDSSESISGHHKRLQIRALSGCVSDPKEYFKISNHTLLVIIFVLELVLFLYNAIIQKYYPTWISNMQKNAKSCKSLMFHVSCYASHSYHLYSMSHMQKQHGIRAHIYFQPWYIYTQYAGKKFEWKIIMNVDWEPERI
jgi:hypothetical protein